MNEIEEIRKKTSSKYYADKILKLEKKVIDVEDKIAKLESTKKELKAEIAHCKDEQILCVVKQSRMTLQEISDSIELAYFMNKSGLSKKDVQELVGDGSSITPNLDINLQGGKSNA